MNSRLRIFSALVILFGLLAALGHSQEKAESSAPANSAPADSAKPLPWLHVEVETSYGWFWQKSTGIAYTTAGRDSKQRVKVGKLCVRLAAHDTTVKCLENADSVVVFEQKKGVGIHKLTAFVSAWTENPKLDTLRVQMNP
ncbi:MAG TPA: hypothetical protein VGL38_09245 [bacterium]|jgi:hypothetical protein